MTTHDELRSLLKNWSDEQTSWNQRKEFYTGRSIQLLQDIKEQHELKPRHLAALTGISASYWCDMVRRNASISHNAIHKLLDALSKNTNQ